MLKCIAFSCVCICLASCETTNSPVALDVKNDEISMTHMAVQDAAKELVSFGEDQILLCRDRTALHYSLLGKGKEKEMSRNAGLENGFQAAIWEQAYSNKTGSTIQEFDLVNAFPVKDGEVAGSKERATRHFKDVTNCKKELFVALSQVKNKFDGKSKYREAND